MQLSVSISRNVGGDSRGLHHSLFVQHGFPHDSVLAGHSASKSTLHLCAQSQLAQVVAFLWGGDETLLQKRLVFQALQAVTEVMEVGQSGVSSRQTREGTFRRGNRGGFADSREPLGCTGLGLS